MTQTIYLDLGNDGMYELEIDTPELLKLLELQPRRTAPAGVRFRPNLTLRITNPASGEQLVARNPSIHLQRPELD